MKIAKSFFLLLFVFFGFSIPFFSASNKPVTENSGSDGLLKVNLTESLAPGARFVEVNNDEPPPIFQFLVESDLVVVASVGEIRAVPSREKKSIDSKEFNINEWMAGSIYPLLVETTLFSKHALEHNLTPVPVGTIETIKYGRTFDQSGLQKGIRYLLFLKQIPRNDGIFEKLELENEKIFYRLFNGTRSIFQDAPDPMHGTNNVGRIDLSTGRYAELIETIRQLCDALSPGDNDLRIHKLEELTKSDNKILSLNAKYAIEYLSKD